MEGRTLGSYRIVQRLAGGGMGSVYLAVHPTIGKRVAIKVLHPDMCKDPELVSRFFQEAKAVNEIRHPNIVDIADFGQTEDGLFFLIMEYLDGRTLRAVMDADKALGLSRALSFARQIGSALGAAHKVGIVHRDLKPANVLVISDDSAVGGERIKLVDFGVAKLLGPDHHADHQTRAGSLVGTPRYMAPEQLLARPVDARADIYSFGVLLFEMLTAERLFPQAELLDFMTMVVKDPPRPARQVRPDVPEWLETLVLRCLEKVPEFRPQQMIEVVEALTVGAQTLSGPNSSTGLPSMGEVRPGGGVPTGVDFASMVSPGPRTTGSIAVTISPRPAPLPGTSGPMPTLVLAPLKPPRATTSSPTAPEITKKPSRPVSTESRKVPAGPTVMPQKARRATLAAYPLMHRRSTALQIIVTFCLVVAALGGAFWFFAVYQPRMHAGLGQVVRRPDAGQSVTLNFDSSPAGADIVRTVDQHRIGVTPFRYTHAVDGSREEFTFRLKGHADARSSFSFGAAGEHHLLVSLTRKSPGQRAVPSQEARRGTKIPRVEESTEAPKPVSPAPPAPQKPPVAAPNPTVAPDDLNLENPEPLLQRTRVKRLGGR